MTHTPTGHTFDTVVIGAGQAGLAAGYYLAQQGREFVILDAASQIGEAWRAHWDSFTLVTPNWALRLPGFPYWGDDPDGFLARDDIVRHLEGYADAFHLPVRFGIRVMAVEAHPSGTGFAVATDSGPLAAANVVVATGMFHRPRVLSEASGLPTGILQLHSSRYRNPGALPPGAVLVVGTAQSGCQIAEELYQSGRQVYLSVGGTGRVPRRYRGRDIFWWLERLGFLDFTYETAPEPKSRFDAPPHLSGKSGGRTLNLHRFARNGVRLLGRVRGAADGRLLLAPNLHQNLARADAFAARVTQAVDGLIAKAGLAAPPAEDEPPLRDGFAIEPAGQLDLASAGIASVVWATGYRPDFGWVRFPVFDGDGIPVQRDGMTEVPGLAFAGLGWPYARKAGMFAGVGDDAARVVAAIADRGRLRPATVGAALAASDD